MSSKRRKAREIALKVLFQVDLIGKNPQESLEQVICEEAIRPALESIVTEMIGKNCPSHIPEGDVAGVLSTFLTELLSDRKLQPPETRVPDITRRNWGENTFSRELTEKILEKLSGFAPLESFASELVDQTSRHQLNIDGILAKCADNWSLERMATIDRVILRFSVCELLHFQDIPVNVTINEAVELAKKYSTERSGEFVNGILDKVQRECKPEKIEPRQRKSAAKQDDEKISSQ